MIDIGANLTDRSFKNDLDDVIEQSWRSGLDHIVITGTDYTLSLEASQIALKDSKRLSHTAGIHPHHADTFSDDILDSVAQLISQSAVAVGETGLDYYRNISSPSNQRKSFQAHIELASSLNQPLFVHDRESGTDTLTLLQRFASTDIVIHCFTGNEELLTAYLELGCYIGITGWVCDERRGNEVADLVPLIPDDRLLLETDAPYLLPRTLKPKPKTRRNEPKNLKFVLQKVAVLRGQSESEVDALTTQNARRFFRLSENEKSH